MKPGLFNVCLIDPSLLHRVAAVLDGEALVSIVPRSGWKDVLNQQGALAPEQRFDLVYVPETAAALAFAGAGFNVLCDPVTAASSEEAEELAKLTRASGTVGAVAHLHTAYPMVRRAMELVREKKIGAVQRVLVTVRQAAQPSGALRSMGPVAEGFIQALTGLKVRSLCASITASAPEHVNIMLQLERPAKGSVWLTQSSTSEEVTQVTVLGEAGELSWRSDACNELWHTARDQASRRLQRAGPESGPLATEATRFAPGHPEGAAEALANIYRGVYEAIRAKREGRARKGLGREFPTVQDAVRTSRFIEAALESDRAGSNWVEL